MQNTKTIPPVAATSHSSYEIRRVTTQDEKIKIYRFRYEEYVEKMGQNQNIADHEKRILTDGLDETAILFAVYQKDILVGTARINFSEDGSFEEDDLYGFSDYELQYPGRIALISKMIVVDGCQVTKLFIELCKQIYKAAQKRDTVVSFISTADHLVPLFERLGFQKYRAPFGLAANQRVSTPMILRNQDIVHLRKIHSPFLSLLNPASIKTSYRERKFNPQLSFLTKQSLHAFYC